MTKKRSPTKRLETFARIGPAIRLLRGARGLDQQEAARLCGITQPRLSAIERETNSPSLLTLDRILTGLQATLVQFDEFLALAQGRHGPSPHSEVTIREHKGSILAADILREALRSEAISKEELLELFLASKTGVAG